MATELTRGRAAWAAAGAACIAVAFLAGCVSQDPAAQAPRSQSPSAQNPTASAPPSPASISTLVPGELAVCMYPGFAPFVSKGSGGWTGWDVTYMQQFAASRSLRFVPVEIDQFDGIWNEPGKGRCDVAASGIAKVDYRVAQTGSAGQWSNQYYRVARSFGIDDTSTLTGIEQLAGKTVIVTKGSTADVDLKSRLARAGITSTTIKYTNDEQRGADRVVKAAGRKGPFAYGGGEGSVQYLTGTTPGLKLAWVHCLMLPDGREVPEPFSFVARAASTGLLKAINAYIADPRAPYSGGPGTDLPCPPPGTGTGAGV